MGRKFLFVLFIILIINVSFANNIEDLKIVKDEILCLNENQKNITNTFQAVSSSGDIILWAEDTKILNGVNISNKSKFNAPLNTDISIPFLIGTTIDFGFYNNTRWNASFNADNTTVTYPAGNKLLSAKISDGNTTTLFTATYKEDDENKQILSADMLPDGTKCVYVVGSDKTSLLSTIVPEMYVYFAKTKKSVKITQAKGTGALWTADGRNIIFERLDDRTRFGEIWMLDSTMALKRIPVGGLVNCGHTVDYNQLKIERCSSMIKYAYSGIGSIEAKMPSEGPSQYVGGYTTGTASLRLVGDTLLVIRNFVDGDIAKRWIGKSYAFVVDLKTMATTRIDCLPKQIFRVATLDVITPGVLAVYALGTDNTSGIYAVDLASNKAKLLRNVDGNPQAIQLLQPNLVVRAGAIYTVNGSEIHKLSLGTHEDVFTSSKTSVTGKEKNTTAMAVTPDFQTAQRDYICISYDSEHNKELYSDRDIRIEGFKLNDGTKVFPFLEVARVLGAKVVSAKTTHTIVRGTITMQITEESNASLINGKPMALSMAPIRDKRGILYIPTQVIDVISRPDFAVANSVYLSCVCPFIETTDGFVQLQIPEEIRPHSILIGIHITPVNGNTGRELLFRRKPDDVAKPFRLEGPGAFLIDLWITTNVKDEDGDRNRSIRRLVFNKDETDRSYSLPTSMFIDSENPEIVKVANDIIKGCKSDMEKTLAIHDWVAENISYNLDAHPHKASEVLQAREGVCMHYAYLVAAFHRAIGMRAKFVEGDIIYTGMKWSDVLPENDLAHAWNEVMVDGKWIIVDATWDSNKMSLPTIATNLNPSQSRTLIRKEGISHEYFNPDPYKFARDHRKSSDSTL